MEKGIEINFFGQLTDVVGTASLQIPWFPDTEQAVQAVLQQFPALKEYTFALALDNKMISTSQPVLEAQTLAFLPPFSGG